MRISTVEARLAERYTGRAPITRGVVWRWRYMRLGLRPSAHVPLSLRSGKLLGGMLWRLGFDYETCGRWS